MAVMPNQRTGERMPKASSLSDLIFCRLRVESRYVV